MRALSIMQPWAHALLCLGKGVENRAWQRRPNVADGEAIIVHAGVKYDRHGESEVIDLVRHLLVDGRDLQLELSTAARGAYLGVIVIGRVHHDGECRKRCRDGIRYCSKWAQPDAWHLPVKTAGAFDAPIPGKGQLGFWTPTDEAVQAAAAHALHMAEP